MLRRLGSAVSGPAREKKIKEQRGQKEHQQQQRGPTWLQLAESGEADCQSQGRQAIGDPAQQVGLETQGTQLGQAEVGALDLGLELVQYNATDLLDGPGESALDLGRGTG